MPGGIIKDEFVEYVLKLEVTNRVTVECIKEYNKGFVIKQRDRLFGGI